MNARFSIIAVFFVIFAGYAELEVYGHGLGARFDTAYYRIEDETISKTTVSVGEPFFINGTLVISSRKRHPGKNGCPV